jgi:hypothetical protein
MVMSSFERVVDQHDLRITLQSADRAAAFCSTTRQPFQTLGAQFAGRVWIKRTLSYLRRIVPTTLGGQPSPDPRCRPPVLFPH